MILNRLLDRPTVGAAVKLGPYRVSHPDGSLIFDGPTASGERVDEQSALCLSAVFCAINLISSTLGFLPWLLYRRLADADEKERDRAHPLWALLHRQPNPEMSAFTFKQTVQGHALGWGNGYAEIERLRSGRPAALWPLTPNRVNAVRGRDADLLYEVIAESGVGMRTLTASDIFHIAGLGFDGLKGYSPIQLARQCIGLGLAAEHFGASFFGNAARPSGAFKHPQKLSDKARGNLENYFRQRRQGPANVGSVLILEEGATWEKLTIDPEDAQFLQTRQFSVVDIARWYNLPPTKLKDMTGTKYATVEYHGLEYQTDTMLPWETRWEQEADRKLLTGAEQQTHFTRFNADAILRADIKMRMEAHSIALNNGIKNIDEVRAAEDLNALPDGEGKVYVRNSALLPARKFIIGGDVQEGETPVLEEKPSGPPPVDLAVLRRKLAVAQAPVIADAMRRMVAVGRTILDRAAKKKTPAAESLEGFDIKVRAALIPAFDALGAVVGSTMEPGDDWAEFVAAHTAAAARSLCAVLVKMEIVDEAALAVTTINYFVLCAEELKP